MPATARARTGSPAGPRDRVGAQVGWATNPLWPLLATMLGGVWMGWTWFAINAVLLGGDRVRKQMTLLVVGLFVSSALSVFLLWLAGIDMLSIRAFKYAVISLAGWKLGVSYMLHIHQRRAFEVYEYYGGKVRNGAVVAFAGIFLRSMVLDFVPFGWWWLVIA